MDLHFFESNKSLSQVIIVLEELAVSYEIKPVRFEDIKKAPFINVNPNGRAPGKSLETECRLERGAKLSDSTDSYLKAIIDPNTNLTLWESGAIIQYLVEQYDTSKKLTFETLPEKHLLNQWLMFQVSGQGPYYGQCGW